MTCQNIYIFFYYTFSLKGFTFSYKPEVLFSQTMLTVWVRVKVAAWSLDQSRRRRQGVRQWRAGITVAMANHIFVKHKGAWIRIYSGNKQTFFWFYTPVYDHVPNQGINCTQHAGDWVSFPNMDLPSNLVISGVKSQRKLINCGFWISVLFTRGGSAWPRTSLG